ncbi:TPA: hypothetical protein ACF3QW_001722 [Enterococcus faecium]
MNKKLSLIKNYRLYLSITLIAYSGALFWQLFLPQLANSFTTWGVNVYWQREIALWNVGMIVLIVVALKSNNANLQWITTLQSTILCIILGFNHLISLVISSDLSAFIHILGVLEVLLLGGSWGLILLIKNKKMFLEIIGNKERSR